MIALDGWIVLEIFCIPFCLLPVDSETLCVLCRLFVDRGFSSRLKLRTETTGLFYCFNECLLTDHLHIYSINETQEKKNCRFNTSELMLALNPVIRPRVSNKHHGSLCKQRRFPVSFELYFPD